MDGNFHAEHMNMRVPGDDLPLSDGHLFTVTNEPYKQHLAIAIEHTEVRHISLKLFRSR